MAKTHGVPKRTLKSKPSRPTPTPAVAAPEPTVSRERFVGTRKMDADAADQSHRMSAGEFGNLQRSAGNKAARLLVQRHRLDPGRQGTGSDDDVIEESDVQRSVATSPAWGRSAADVVQRKGPDPKVAQKAFDKFVAGGPYKINNFVPDFTENFGKFDVAYHPAAKRLDIDMRVKFTFPDLPAPKKGDPLEAAFTAMNDAIKTLYAANFIGQVTKGWSGKFDFRNAREPQAVWGNLNPISVKLNVTKDDANPHYVMKAHLLKTATANVTPNPADNVTPGTISLFKGDLDPSTQPFTGSKNTATDEVTRLQRNLPKIHFGNGSSKIDAKYLGDLHYVADYLARMSRPKFDIVVVGRANKSGPEPDNLKISSVRATNTMDKLKALGVTNHGLKARGDGSAGATADGSWRKVDFEISTDPAFSNVQDTTLHEFGHMIGLDDEYQAGRAIQLKHQRQFMRKMLGNEAYGKKQKDKYADEITTVDALQSASVMYSGDEVRAGHYVTMWQSLYNAAQKAPDQPSPKFSFKDWKVIG